MFSISQKEASKILQLLVRKKQTIALAESVTAGLLHFAFASIPNASQFLQGGIVAFNAGQKYKHLNVEPIHAETVNSVSQKVAIEMARHVCEMFSSDWGIGVTGYATPVAESDFKLFAYCAIVCRGVIKQKGRIIPKQTQPAAVQEEYVQHIIQRMSSQ